jgi:hypothetical protein
MIDKFEAEVVSEAISKEGRTVLARTKKTHSPNWPRTPLDLLSTHQRGICMHPTENFLIPTLTLSKLDDALVLGMQYSFSLSLFDDKS